MDPKERERLENCCRMCREINSPGEQLLLIKLEDVEECLKVDKMMRDILEVMNKFDDMRKTLRAEVMGTCEQEENSGEIEGDPEICERWERQGDAQT